MISSFVLFYYFRTLFIKTNSSWIITESIKGLEINASMLFILDFANNTILSCFFFFCYWLTFLNSCSYWKGIPTKEATAEMETHPVIVEAKIRKYLR